MRRLSSLDSAYQTRRFLSAFRAVINIEKAQGARQRLMLETDACATRLKYYSSLIETVLIDAVGKTLELR